MLGVSTRRVDDLVRALGIDGISRSEVSRICAAPRRRGRGLPGPLARGRGVPVRVARRDVPQGPRGGPGGVDGGPRRDRRRRSTGERRILGLELAPGNDEGSAWPAFIRSLVERGLHGVRLVISDDHAGPREGGPGAAPGLGLAALPGPLHPQRPGPRPALGAEHGRLGHPGGVRAARRGIGPRRSAAGSSTCSEPRFPAVAELLADAEPDLLAHFTFPETHRRRIRSTNPLERLNKEIKRRTAVVGIFPNRASVIRLVGMVLAEQDDEWQDGRRYFRPETMARIDAVVDTEGGGPGAPHGELTIRREDDALLHHVLGLDPPLAPSRQRRMIGGAELARTIPGPEDVVHPRAARRALYPPGWNLDQPPPKAVRGRGPYGTPARQVVCVDDGLATAQAPHRGSSAGPRVHTCGVATEGTPSLRGQAPGCQIIVPRSTTRARTPVPDTGWACPRDVALGED